MDILTHTVSGAAAGGVVAAVTSNRLPQKALIVLCGALAALLPDMDALSLWSRFDTVIGQPIGLSTTGSSIYFGNRWYSHHNWTHSLVAGAVFTLLVGLICYLGNRIGTKGLILSAYAKKYRFYLLAFFLGYIMHLVGDLPTPGHTWRGIKLFWPLATPIGGTGHLWWWNNYDIFILWVVCCTAMAVSMIVEQVLKSPYLKFLPALILVVTLMTSIHQITHRPMRFTYNQQRSNHAENERQSLAAQKIILGEQLYGIMVTLDRHLKIYF